MCVLKISLCKAGKKRLLNSICPKSPTKYWQLNTGNPILVTIPILAQPVAEMLGCLHVQVSSISCNVVGSILALHAWKTVAQQLYRRLADWGGGTPRPELLTGAKKSQLGCLISFKLPMGFQNFITVLIKFAL